MENTEKTILAEQKQNPSSTNSNAERDVGRSMTEDTSSTGGGLDRRLDEADGARARDHASAKAYEHAQVVGDEDKDAHEAAAAKQP